MMSEDKAAGRPGGHGGAPGEDRKVDVSERGAPKNGQPQTMDRRLFMQLLVFDCPAQSNPEGIIKSLGEAFKKGGVSATIYEDANAPRGIGVLTWSEDETVFVDKVRPALNSIEPSLTLRPEMTMMGRSYSGGYEDDLEFWLLRRPAETVTNESWRWAVWYPLRRTGAFAQLEPREQAGILREHAMIGRAYGAEDLAHDVRLACHGLDTNDNEFVIGLVGSKLHPLSHVIQSMRKTRQTSEYISHMGPFFVGRAVFQHRA